MVSPVAPHSLPMIALNLSSGVESQHHKQDAAVHVHASAESRSQNQEYQRWSKRHEEENRMGQQKSSLDSALEQLNENMKAWSTGLRFEVDEETQKLIVSLIDSKSGEIIRTVPSDAALQISKMIATFQGNSINTKA